jgi:hypothetical protein
MKRKLTWSGDLAGRKSDARASLVLGGDVCPIGRYEKKILAGEPVFDDTLLGAFQESDFTLINLEAPLCAGQLPCNNPGESGLRADPGVAAYLRRAGIDAVGLANNHIRDFGNEGYRQTARSLDREKIRHTGAGRNLAEAQQPLAVTLNGIKVGIWALAEKELNVAESKAAGSSWFRPETDVVRLREMRPAFDVLLAYVHAGHEFMSTPSPRIRAAYRSLVDAGADAVIGHHPHVVQGAETYKGKLILYSLGNLVFDSPYVARHPDTDTGFLARLDISKRGVVGASFIPYRLRPQTIVTVLERRESAAFAKRFRALSAAIVNERTFTREWERNVRRRWEGEFRAVLEGLSGSLRDPARINSPRRTRNLITCPTHVELLTKAFEMMEAGKIQRH